MLIKEDSHSLSLIKGILYRFFGTICTILISFIFTKNVTISLSIGIVEVVSKVLLYYVYERLWLLAMKKIYKKESING